MKYIQWYLLLFSSVLLLAGCDNKKEDQVSISKKNIIIATSGEPSPFTTVNNKGELIGYDIDVVKAVFAELPQYQISFEITEFTSVLAGLDAERYQVGANNFAMNEQRKEKYFYSDPIFLNQYVIAVRENDNSIYSFEDLKGRSTETTPGLNYATALEHYNRQNPINPINIYYSEADLLALLQHVESGKYDFQLVDRAMLQQFIDQHQLKLKSVELNAEDSARIGLPYSYLLISKGKQGEQLTEDINQGIKEIIKNGKLAEISYHYFNADYSPKS